MSAPENPAAFPAVGDGDYGDKRVLLQSGMTLRDYFAAQALKFVDDRYPEWQLKAWFGDRVGIMREEIRAKAAYAYADAMLAERAKAVAL